jgi:hypothetical protein
MEQQVEIFVAAFLLIIGLSHIAHPRAWIDFFAMLRSKGPAGVFVAALVNLMLGLMILALHPRWTGIALVITLIGCIWTLKGAVYFIFPSLGMKAFSLPAIQRTRHWVVGGCISIALAGLSGLALLYG